MIIKNVTITVETDKGSKKYQLNQTAEASKNEKGKMSKAHFQPSDTNKVIMQYGKVYIDTVELDKQLTVKAK
uniref:Uncharacterized protein n=1 Tax=viral metagenome TaxID=1070528 RepID=A0A6M3XUS1_9ZZZZ